MVVMFAFARTGVLAGTVLFLFGLGAAGFSAMQATLIFLSVRRDLRSHAMGALTVSMGVAPLGFLHVAWLVDFVGAANALLIMAGEGLLTLMLVLWRWPELR
jgi:hypothetical protein